MLLVWCRTFPRYILVVPTPMDQRRFSMDVFKLQSLFRKHAYHVASVKGWLSEGDGPPFYKAWLHAELLLRLDLLIFEHRKEAATAWEPLLGRRALNHLLFVRTNLTPEQIARLSFDEILLVLHQDLKAVNIPPEVLVLPDFVRNGLAFEIHHRSPGQTELPPCSEDEWDPTFAEIAQGLRNQ
ncbi:ECs1072 family phage-associated protein [Serratia marcescens]|uniref:ECs1072 family phage-associated protein n=1 Tax=Serratia marcescens TaxID=615 RepID=UPI003ED9B53E